MFRFDILAERRNPANPDPVPQTREKGLTPPGG